MPAPHDPSLARVRVSTTSGGTYNLVGFVRSADLDRGSEGETTLKYLGGEAVRPGDPTLAGTIPVFWEEGDTNGQAILETAWQNGTTVWLQFGPKGVGSGAKVKQFEAYITAAPFSFDAEGDSVEGSFSFRGIVSTLTEVTLL